MSGGHRITRSTTNGKAFAYCSCRFATEQGDGPAVEAEVQKHLRNVEVAQAALATSTPSLKQQLDHYESMIKDPEVSEYDRGLWRQLATELRHRLGLDARDYTEPGLW